MLCVAHAAIAQQILSGSVVDAKTGEKLPFVNVVYPRYGRGTQTNLEGKFKLPFHQGKLRISAIGYDTRDVVIKKAGTGYVFKLESIESELKTATVTAKKGKYSRKNNPAVELMKKVIAAKQNENGRYGLTI